MRRNWAAVSGLAIVLGACTDGTGPASVSAAPGLRSDEGRGDLHRYVAMGTSISMGWSSNGVYRGTQETAWPAQLARLAGRDMTLPLIEAPGCTSPIVPPLALAARLSGESIAGSTVCAPNVEGVVLPTANVGIAGALAHEALSLTPEAAGAAKPFYARVLPPGATQLSAMLAQEPKVVSVEFGGNEVLQASRGVIDFTKTVVPLSIYMGAMARLLDAIPAEPKVVVVGMPTAARNLPSLRHASEIWAARLAYAALHVSVDGGCETSENWFNVSTKGLATIYEGQQRKARGFPMATLSCADVPGAVDDVVTPATMDSLDTMLAQINGFLQQQAAARGYAYATIGALYDRADIKAPFNPVAQLTSPTPYGPLISLDAVHPSAAGHTVLADAVARALNATYGLNIPTVGEAGVLLAVRGSGR